MLIDTHLHLDFDRFDGDRDQVVARAGAAGVGAMITIGTDLASSRRAIALAERYDTLWAAVGVHPNEAGEWGPDTAVALRELATHPRVVAIGEIGLDYYWERVPPDRQREVLEAQLTLAAEVGLPVIIHDREAHEPLMTILREWVSTLTRERSPGVLHFFSGELAMAREALAAGWYLGVDGPLTYPSAGALRELVAQLPLTRLLVETDAPFLAPQPYRGKRNEPAYVRAVAEQLAALHNITFEAVAAQTTANARHLFDLGRDE